MKKRFKVFSNESESSEFKTSEGYETWQLAKTFWLEPGLSIICS